ncbi:MAG: hypothetical protein ACO1TE_16355 [Prosthecobacter sp.]
MKTRFHSSFAAFVAALVLGAGAALHADYNDNAALASYADQLRYQGIRGPRFVQLVDQRYWRLYPMAAGHPGNRGIGSYVLALQERGLHGRDLARAVHAEQDRRWHAHIPPGQAKKYGPSRGMKPKDKASFFGSGRPDDRRR